MPVNRSDFITRTPLEGVAFDFFVDESTLLAKQCCNVVPVDKAEKKIYQRDLSKLRLIDDEKGTNDEPNLVDQQLFSRDVTLLERKLGSEINPRNVRDADMPQLLDEAEQTKIVTQNLMLSLEKRFDSFVTTQGNYRSTLTAALASGSRWNESGGQPEADKITIDNAMLDSCGRRPNALLMGYTTYAKLKLSPEWRDRTKYTGAGSIPDELIKAYFGIEYLFVGAGRYDSSVFGGTPSMQQFYGDSAVFFIYDPSAGERSQNAFMLPVIGSPFWVDVSEDPKRVGNAGKMKRVTVGTEYTLTPGYVESQSSSLIAAAYLLRTVVA